MSRRRKPAATPAMQTKASAQPQGPRWPAHSLEQWDIGRLAPAAGFSTGKGRPKPPPYLVLGICALMRQATGARIKVRVRPKHRGNGIGAGMTMVLINHA
jgi:hypothetical protein